jgi:hypothetical protein
VGAAALLLSVGAAALLLSVRSLLRGVVAALPEMRAPLLYAGIQGGGEAEGRGGREYRGARDAGDIEGAGRQRI